MLARTQIVRLEHNLVETWLVGQERPSTTETIDDLARYELLEITQPTLDRAALGQSRCMAEVGDVRQLMSLGV